MKIEYLKRILQETGSSSVEKVYFDSRHIINTDREKDYPYVLWNLDTFVSLMNWGNTSQQKETVTMTAFCVGYHDSKAQSPSSPATREEVFDSLREAFREYLSEIMKSEYIEITNLNSMRNELYQIGITIDSEIGVSFNVEMKLYCNAEIPT